MAMPGICDAPRTNPPLIAGLARDATAVTRETPDSLANPRRILQNSLTRLGAVMSEKEGRVSGTRWRVSVPATEMGLLLIFVLLAAAGSL